MRVQRVDTVCAAGSQSTGRERIRVGLSLRGSDWGCPLMKRGVDRGHDPPAAGVQGTAKAIGIGVTRHFSQYSRGLCELVGT
jgi:hypothetical protein